MKKMPSEGWLLSGGATWKEKRHVIETDTSTHMSNLENPAHHHGREGSLQKGAMFYTHAECKSSLQAALGEKDNYMDVVLPQQPCFP
jgi:hypothetical protein